MENHQRDNLNPDMLQKSEVGLVNVLRCQYLYAVEALEVDPYMNRLTLINFSRGGYLEQIWGEINL